MIINELPFISEAECEKTREGVLALRDHWYQRSLKPPIYTMGVTAWQIQSDRNPYYAEKERSNQLLRARLGWLYEKMATRFTEYLGETATTSGDKTALPAFQIHFWPIKFSPLHVDVHHYGIRWDPYDKVDDSRFFSFVLPIHLSSGGGGMDYWELDVSEFDRLSAVEQKVIVASDRRHIPYRLGQIYLHWGRVLHQASPIKSRKGEMRIIIQGHGIRCNGIWQLFG